MVNYLYQKDRMVNSYLCCFMVDTTGWMIEVSVYTLCTQNSSCSWNSRKSGGMCVYSVLMRTLSQESTSPHGFYFGSSDQRGNRHFPQLVSLARSQHFNTSTLYYHYACVHCTLAEEQLLQKLSHSASALFLIFRK